MTRAVDGSVFLVPATAQGCSVGSVFLVPATAQGCSVGSVFLVPATAQGCSVGSVFLVPATAQGCGRFSVPGTGHCPGLWTVQCFWYRPVTRAVRGSVFHYTDQGPVHKQSQAK